jgi:hypothetical protein
MGSIAHARRADRNPENAASNPACFVRGPQNARGLANILDRECVVNRTRFKMKILAE